MFLTVRSVNAAPTIVLADATVHLRRLVVVEADEESRPHALLAPSDARRLVASVLSVVEREADAGIGEAAA